MLIDRRSRRERFTSGTLNLFVSTFSLQPKLRYFCRLYLDRCRSMRRGTGTKPSRASLKVCWRCILIAIKLFTISALETLKPKGRPVSTREKELSLSGRRSSLLLSIKELNMSIESVIDCSCVSKNVFYYLTVMLMCYCCFFCYSGTTTTILERISRRSITVSVAIKVFNNHQPVSSEGRGDISELPAQLKYTSLHRAAHYHYHIFLYKLVWGENLGSEAKMYLYNTASHGY
jgi:hypothetical protein